VGGETHAVRPTGAEGQGLEALLCAAFASGDARDAGALIMAQREFISERAGAAWSYEVDLGGEAPVAYLVSYVLPRLIYFLKSRGSAAGQGVFLSLFREERVYFVSAPDALALFCEWTGETLAALQARYGDDLTAT